MPFTARKALRITRQITTWILMMHRNRIVNQRLHATRLQMLLHGTPIAADDDKQMIDMRSRFLRGSQQADVGVSDAQQVGKRDLLPALGEFGQPFQAFIEDRSL